MNLTHFATSNVNKLREVNEILGLELEHIKLDLLEPQGLLVEDIVKTKAIEAFHLAEMPVLVEDTGLEFAAWNGLPGALVKWFLDSVGPEGILTMLGNSQNRAATAKTVVAYHDGKSTHTFTGEVSGTIITEIVDKGGFGWDGLFLPDGYTATFAGMTSEQKNAFSMRKLALDKLRQHLEEEA